MQNSTYNSAAVVAGQDKVHESSSALHHSNAPGSMQCEGALFLFCSTHLAPLFTLAALCPLLQGIPLLLLHGASEGLASSSLII